MKKNITLLVVSFVFAIFSFVGCDIVDDNPIEPGGNQDGRISGQPLPTFSYIQNMNGIMATIQFGYSIPVIGSIDYVMGFARFGTNGIDAGSVSVNGENINKQFEGSQIYYNSFNSASPQSLQNVNFNNSNHSWAVTGSGSLPAFNASVVSPTSFNITKPNLNATVSKQDGLNVQWSGGSSASQDSVMIVVVPTTQQQQTPFVSRLIPNNGNHTISTAELINLSGACMLQVVKLRYRIHTATDGKNYVVLSQIVETVNFTLQ